MWTKDNRRGRHMVDLLGIKASNCLSIVVLVRKMVKTVKQASSIYIHDIPTDLPAYSAKDYLSTNLNLKKLFIA